MSTRHPIPKAGPASTPTRNAERTREQILSAAFAEFAARGLGGARVRDIAERAQANKAMIYHYFGDKEGLYRAVLEGAYEAIRARQQALDLEAVEPLEGFRRLVGFTFDFVVDNPDWVSLLNDENLHRARHLKGSATVRPVMSPLIATIEELLARGQAAGSIRPGVDPVSLYIAIAAMGYFYVSNRHTLSAIFGRDLMAKKATDGYRAHMVETVVRSLVA